MAKKRDPGPSVKDAGLYEALRDDGASKEKAARIANAAAARGRRAVARKGGEAFEPVRAVGFGLIWAALGVYSLEGWWTSRR